MGPAPAAGARRGLLARRFSVGPGGGRLVIARHNAGKVREIGELLQPWGATVVSAGEMGLPEPKLPAWVAERSLHRDDFRRIIDAIIPWLRKLERLTKPRWLGVTGLASERWLGAFCLLLSLVLVLPIPLGNLMPAVAVTLVALGLIEKDGIFVALGLVVGAGSLVLVAGVVSAMALTAVFFVREVLS